MPDVVLVKALAKTLLLPPTGPLLLVLVGLAVVGRHPRSGRIVAAAGAFALLGLSLPIVSTTLIRFLDDAPPLDLAQARTAQAIVVPGGGVRRNASEYSGDTLGRLTLERVRYGARLARQTGLPVLVTGGSPTGDTLPEATLMKAALAEEFSVATRWTEERSRNTRENAVYTAAILRADGVRKIVLVAHSFDARRARAEFARAGIDEIIVAPTGIPGTEIDWPGDFLPSIAGLQASYYACYELAALALNSLTNP